MKQKQTARRKESMSYEIVLISRLILQEALLFYRYIRMSCIQLTVRARNRTTPQYFTCFGRLHVKVN